MEVLGGEVDGFEVTLEPEFTWVLVKVKGLGGAGALREPMDSNSSFPIILTPSCFPPLPLFYMDSETMGDQNVRCLSLIGCTDCESIEVRIG